MNKLLCYNVSFYRLADIWSCFNYYDFSLVMSCILEPPNKPSKRMTIAKQWV